MAETRVVSLQGDEPNDGSQRRASTVWLTTMSCRVSGSILSSGQPAELHNCSNERSRRPLNGPTADRAEPRSDDPESGWPDAPSPHVFTEPPANGHRLATAPRHLMNGRSPIDLAQRVWLKSQGSRAGVLRSWRGGAHLQVPDSKHSNVVGRRPASDAGCHRDSTLHRPPALRAARPGWTTRLTLWCAGGQGTPVLRGRSSVG